MSAKLSERKKLILKAIVEAYIENGEPVGSKLLAQDEQIKASSATIRNEMAELIEMGYLIQPHTSAGRIPSETAYRFYVDSLKESYNDKTSEIENLNEMLKVRTAELDKIIEDAGKLASALTNYPAIAVKSSARRKIVKKFSVMPNDSFGFLLIMLIDKDTVRSKSITTKFPVDEQALSALQNVLNENLADIEMDNITLSTIMNIERKLGDYGFLASPVIKSIYEALGDGAGSDIRIEGVDRLLSYPEFADIGKLRSLLGLFDKKQELIDVVEGAKQDEVNVYIGSENTVKTMNDSSLVFKTITVNGVSVGAIGVIGPCRMDYQKVITTIDKISESIASSMMQAPSELPDGSHSEEASDNGGEKTEK